MNLPNKITIIRICMIPLFMLIYFSPNIENSNLIATIIFTLAAVTDGLDGYLARSRNEITTFGKFMDPLADKLLISAALISLVQTGQVKAWIVILILAREFFITGFRTLAASNGLTIAASKLGKTKTVSQILAIIVTMMDDFGLSFPLGKVLMYLALFFTLLSGFDYIYKNKHIFNGEY